LEYYNHIDEIGVKLNKIIADQIEPLLTEGNFDEAIQMVRDFYKPSRLDNASEGPGMSCSLNII